MELTPHEFSVVDCLFWHTPKPVDFGTLTQFVWGDDEAEDKRSLIQVYVSYVRRKLKESKRVTIRHVAKSATRLRRNDGVIPSVGRSRGGVIPSESVSSTPAVPLLRPLLRGFLVAALPEVERCSQQR